MYSFLILSILVTPNENRNIFNSATSISASCLFVTATVSNPYNIAGLTATLYTFPFTLAGTRLSQITPDILLQPFHPACTLFFTTLLHSPLLCTVEPRYLKSSTFATSSPCIFTVPLTCLSFTHMYSVFLLLTFSPKHISSSPASVLAIPCSRCRSQCHLQTSWSIELPLWYHLSSYPSPWQINKGSKPILGAVPPSHRTFHHHIL